jgi:hypothetical protein
MGSPSRSARSTASPVIPVGGLPAVGVASRGSPCRVAIERGVESPGANSVVSAYSVSDSLLPIEYGPF